MVRDTTNVVTTVTREIQRAVIVGDTDSSSDNAMDVSSSEDLPENPLRALAAAYRAAHAFERRAAHIDAHTTAAPASASTAAANPSSAPRADRANAGAGAGTSAAGPSRGAGSAAATRIRRQFIGPRRETVYVPSSGSEAEAANASVEDDAAAKENAAVAEEEADAAEDVGKGKGKARA